MSITISEKRGVRYLHFGSPWIQGAMRIARPYALELDYTRDMMAALLLRGEPRWPRRVLLIGLGAASLTKFLHRHRPEARLTVVEIDPRVVAAARQFFKLPDEDARLTIRIADGADYVTDEVGPFDLILVDGYDADARTGLLDTIPFYLNCRARLTADGLLVANLLSRRGGHAGSLARLREAFEQRALLFPSLDGGNAIAVAAHGEPIALRLDELKQQARTLKLETGLNLLTLLARLEQARSCRDGRFEL